MPTVWAVLSVLDMGCPFVFNLTILFFEFNPIFWGLNKFLGGYI